MSFDKLAKLFEQYPNIFALTGAGVSAASGIPTYRDHGGKWKSATPIQHQEFVDDAKKRQRYWARSAVGWPMVNQAKPNITHQVLAEMEAQGWIKHLVTQNVDRLHQQAGHQQVTDLHGRIDRTVCLECGTFESRQDIQTRLLEENSFLTDINRQPAPDGDAHLNDDIISQVTTPNCLKCGGLIKPDVVFFGGTVAAPIVKNATDRLAEADMMLVVGSSLMVYSGFRFCKLAVELNKPLVVINQGQTRADDLLTHKFSLDSGQLLRQTLEMLN